MDPVSFLSTGPPSQFIGTGQSRKFGQRKFYSRGGRGNWNQNPYVTPTSIISLKPKTPDLLSLSDYQKLHPFKKTLFKEIREIFPLAGRLKYFLKHWEKLTNDSTILTTVKSFSIDFVETPYQPRTPIRAKLSQVKEELVL